LGQGERVRWVAAMMLAGTFVPAAHADLYTVFDQAMAGPVISSRSAPRGS
jgi:HEAT repeat protein